MARILTAARQAFYEKGFHDVSVEEIARLSDLSRATVYLYFPKKDDILLALLRGDMGHQMAEYDKLAAIECPSAAALQEWLGSFRAVMDERRGSLALFHVSFNITPEIAASVSEHRELAIAKLGARYKGFDLGALEGAAREVQRAKCYMMIFLIEEVAVTFSVASATPALPVGQAVLAQMLLGFLETGEISTG